MDSVYELTTHTTYIQYSPATISPYISPLISIYNIIIRGYNTIYSLNREQIEG